MYTRRDQRRTVTKWKKVETDREKGEVTATGQEKENPTTAAIEKRKVAMKGSVEGEGRKRGVHEKKTRRTKHIHAGQWTEKRELNFLRFLECRCVRRGGAGWRMQTEGETDAHTHIRLRA